MAKRISASDSGYRSGDLSVFPEALDDFVTLYRVTNNATSKLKQTLSFNAKTVVVDSTAGFPANGIIRLGTVTGKPGAFEMIAYGSKTANTFKDLQRGFAGSRQSVWFVGDTLVTGCVAADQHNTVKDAVINMERNFGLRDNPDPESLNGILKSLEARFLAPKPLFRAFPTKGPPPLTVRFQNFSTGHIVRTLWDFGDGTNSIERSPTHVYASEGVYTVKLNVVAGTGAQGIATKTDYIEVNEDESIPFIYVDNVASPYSVETATRMTLEGLPTDPKQFMFVDQSDGDIVQRNWVFGDGESFTQDDPDIHTVEHIYQSPNPEGYVVTCLIIFSNGRLKRVELTDPLIVL